RYVIEPVEIRDRLQIGLVFDQFFGAAVQQANMRIDALDDFPVHFKDQPHHAVRRRVLRPEIQHKIADARLAFDPARPRRARLAHPPPSFEGDAVPAFSSPGSSLSIPSHGDRKSKLRNSWSSRTGS